MLYFHKKTRGECVGAGLVFVITPTSPQVRQVKRYYTFNEEQTKIRDIVKVQNGERLGQQEERGRDRESALVSANKVTWRTRGFCTNYKSRGRGGSERGREREREGRGGMGSSCNSYSCSCGKLSRIYQKLIQK